jgi:hypothetical protein
MRWDTGDNYSFVLFEFDRLTEEHVQPIRSDWHIQTNIFTNCRVQIILNAHGLVNKIYHKLAKKLTLILRK